MVDDAVVVVDAAVNGMHMVDDVAVVAIAVVVDGIAVVVECYCCC